MKEVVLPPEFPKPRPDSKIVSARVDENRFQKWKKLQLRDGSRIRPSDLMEYMIDYFYEEVYGEDK
tara:strand:- start:291 stop:488 length:198 start_codon:yes stop_codon:yes gene_type:complete